MAIPWTDEEACGLSDPESYSRVPEIKDSMNIKYIEEASKVVSNKQQLVNMVSKRVRELSAGSRPMVETDLNMGLSDIALAEIGAGKLTIEVALLSDDQVQ